MANKKKRKPRNRRPPGSKTTPVASGSSPRGGANPDRRERKERARQAREAERKRAQRTAAVRRAGVFAVAGVVLLGVLWWFQRASSPRPIPKAAVAAAEAAVCSGVETPSGDAPGGLHLESGQSYTYEQHPPTSGYHDPSALPSSPEVYTAPVPETQAVHFLEHAGVILYYRADGDGALPQDVIDSLATVAKQQKNTLVAPYRSLPAGTSMAMTAWNKLQTCPGTVTASQASTIANGFVTAFGCTANAPEPKASDDC